MMQQSRRRRETTLALVTSYASEITERMMFQRGQMPVQVDLRHEPSLTDIATVDIRRPEIPLWIHGSMMLHHNVSVQRRLAAKILLAHLARYPPVNLVGEVLVQSLLVGKVFLAVAAPELRGVEVLEVLDRLGDRLENHGTHVTIAVFFISLMVFQSTHTRE